MTSASSSRNTIVVVIQVNQKKSIKQNTATIHQTNQGPTRKMVKSFLSSLHSSQSHYGNHHHHPPHHESHHHHFTKPHQQTQKKRKRCIKTPKESDVIHKSRNNKNMLFISFLSFIFLLFFIVWFCLTEHSIHYSPRNKMLSSSKKPLKTHINGNGTVSLCGNFSFLKIPFCKLNRRGHFPLSELKRNLVCSLHTYFKCHSM